MKYFKKIIDKSALALCHNVRVGFVALVFIILLTTLSEIYSQWRKIEIPQLFDNTFLLDIFFLDSNPNYGWVCGHSGVVLRTTDGGETWNGVTIGNPGGQLESIHFVNENVGFVANATTSIIFKTTDGGITWRSIFVSTNNPVVEGYIDVWGIYALDENRIFATGGGCGGYEQYFTRSMNGGQTWTYTAYDDFETKLSDVIVYEDGSGYAVSSGYLWVTANFGANWDVLAETGGVDWHEEITFFDGSFLLPYSQGCNGTTLGTGGARFTADYGATWNNLVLEIPFFGSFLTGKNEGWAVGFDESIYYTSDAGVTWELKNCGLDPGADMDDIWFVNDSTAFVVGDGIYKMSTLKIEFPEILSEDIIDLCDGESVTLTLNRDYDFYSWSNGATTKSITVDKPGDYYVDAWNNKCDSGRTKTVSVNFFDPEPLDLILSDNQPCEGEVVTITVEQDYDNYTWSNGATTKEIEVTESGTYSVAYTNPTTLCTYIAETNVDFTKIPDLNILLNGRIQLCVGQTTDLIASEGFNTYEWYEESDPNTAISNDRILQVGESGRFFVIATVGVDCIEISEAIEIEVLDIQNGIRFALINEPPLDFGDVTFPNLECATLEIFNTESVPLTIDNPYMFRNIAFSIPQHQLPIVIPPFVSRTLQVCYKPTRLEIQRDTILFKDNCSDVILPVVANGLGNNYEGVTKCDVGLELSTIEIVSRYDFDSGEPSPNPAFGKVSVNYAKVEKEGDATYSEKAHIYDLFGNLLLTAKVNIDNVSQLKSGFYESGNFEFDTTELSSGFYLILIESKNNRKTYPLSIVK